MAAAKSFQQQMATLMPEYQQRFSKEQDEYWNNTSFTAELPTLFPKYKLFGMAFSSCEALNISPDYWTSIAFGNKQEYTLADIITICRATQPRTLHEWIMNFGRSEKTPAEYATFLRDMECVTQAINELIEPEKDRLIRKMQALQKAGVKAPIFKA